MNWGGRTINTSRVTQDLGMSKQFLSWSKLSSGQFKARTQLSMQKKGVNLHEEKKGSTPPPNFVPDTISPTEFCASWKQQQTFLWKWSPTGLHFWKRCLNCGTNTPSLTVGLTLLEHPLCSDNWTFEWAVNSPVLQTLALLHSTQASSAQYRKHDNLQC